MIDHRSEVSDVIPDKIEKALNDQLRAELQSAYLYLSMSAACEEQSLPGMAAWLRQQWQEEINHALKFYKFILDRDGRVELQGLDAPPSKFGSPTEVFESALENEREVTRSINDIYELVASERDFSTQALLDWFVTEQVEEEAAVQQIVDDLKRVGAGGEGLYLLDRELGSRGGTAAAAG